MPIATYTGHVRTSTPDGIMRSRTERFESPVAAQDWVAAQMQEHSRVLRNEWRRTPHRALIRGTVTSPVGWQSLVCLLTVSRTGEVTEHRGTHGDQSAPMHWEAQGTDWSLASSPTLPLTRLRDVVRGIVPADRTGD